MWKGMGGRMGRGRRIRSGEGRGKEGGRSRVGNRVGAPFKISKYGVFLEANSYFTVFITDWRTIN
jgi:hypothetical protein